MSGWKSSTKGIKARLFIAAFVPLIAFVLLIGIARFQAKELGSMLDESYNNIQPNIRTIGTVLYTRANIGIYLGAAIAASDPKNADAMVAEAKLNLERFKTSLQEYEDAPDIDGEKEAFELAKQSKEKFVSLSEKAITLLGSHNNSDTTQAMEILYGDWLAASRSFRTSMEKVLDLYKDYSAAKKKQEETSQRNADVILFSSAAAFGLFVLAYLFFISNSISKNISSAASGLTTSTDEITSAIELLTGAGSGLSNSSTGAAASLEETVASLEEITSMVKMNSDNAKQAAALSQSSREAAEEGESEIKNLISSMTEISSSSRKIEEIIHVIDDIAFQTNLLALNAAVEAARAGEQGKGFAVVAEAVRALAQRSAAAAKDITSLIKDSVHKIERGTVIADKSGSVLNNIVTSVKKVSDLNNEIAAASEEQTSGISQISKAMNQLDQGAQANAAAAEEIAATSSELASQTRMMQEFVKSLNFLVHGNSEHKTDVPSVENRKPEKSGPSFIANTFSKLGPNKTVKSIKSDSKPKAQASNPSPEKEVKTESASKEKIAKVVPFKPKESSAAASMIPFDEDEPRTKLGSTDDF